MMNDEQGGQDWLSDGPVPADLDGDSDRSAGGASASGYRSAVAGSSASYGAPAHGSSAQGGPAQGGPAQGGGAHGGPTLPGDEPPTGPIGPPVSADSAGGLPPPDQPDSDQPLPGKPAGQKKGRSGWRELPILIVVALAIALVIKTFVVQPFFIPSSSMEDTLMIGDKVLVNKLVYHFRSIEPGDIIVFNGVGSWNPAAPATKASTNPLDRAYDATLRPLFHSIAGLFGTPVGQTDYIKRVIGVPGDRVACCNAHGLVTVNGVALHESSYLYPGATPSAIHFNIVVPPGRLWVMGDNRAVSDDSRLRLTDPGHGTIPENEVIGRAFVIVWPPSHWRILPIPSTFHQPGIAKPASSAQGQPAISGSAQTLAEQNAAAAAVLGAKLKPEPPYVPLAAGLIGAVPLTWLQRRARLRLAGRLRTARANRRR